jgi:hypothetical protein
MMMNLTYLLFMLFNEYDYDDAVEIAKGGV